MIKRLALVLSVLVLCGCRHLTMTSFETGERVRVVTHSLSHRVWVHMPDGEILEGKFSAIPEAAVGYGFGSATAFGGGGSATAFGSSTSIAVGSHGTFYIIASSTKPGSHLAMQIEGTYSPFSGSGFGEAITNDGRKYKIVF